MLVDFLDGKPVGFLQVSGIAAAKTIAELATAATYTLPDYDFVVLEVETQTARARFDGTAPTASIGHLLPLFTSSYRRTIWTKSVAIVAKIIESTGSTKINFSFFKR